MARSSRSQIVFWRTHTVAEVDLILESDGCLLPIEVKSGTRVGSGDARHLLTFREQ